MNSGDTAWVLASAALVMLMTPGLAFFYGGMVRSRSVLNMLMMNFIALAIVSVLWMMYGFSLSFSNDAFSGLLGNFDFAGLHNAAGGWIANNLKALDFAGGTAVHINAGAAGLALAFVLGKRKGWPKDAPRPHNVPFVLLGASMLWFGWYGFNAGSALTAGDLAG